jgi:hypothetical protein
MLGCFIYHYHCNKKMRKAAANKRLAAMPDGGRLVRKFKPPRLQTLNS